MKNTPLSYIEISKKNLLHNAKQWRTLIGKNTKIAGVLKANAYGHGDVEVARIIAPYVDYFQVNSVAELMNLREVTRKPVLVLGYVPKSEMKKCMELGAIIGVFDLAHALELNAVAQKIGKKQKVHIAIDAHLGREGMMPADLVKILPELKKLKNLVIDGVYAHFANIEDTTDLSHAQKQIEVYENVLKLFHENGFKNIKTHISATSGILAYEKWKGIHNIARIGIGLYGLWPSTELEKSWKRKIVLRPVLRFVSHIAQVKTLPKGHTVGYGLTYRAKEDIQIAVVPVGYADGLSREISNKGKVLIKGKRAPIIGRVMMNMIVVDVSNIKGIKRGDEVVIIGEQKMERISAEELARDMGTINYEVTTHLSPLLPRIVV